MLSRSRAWSTVYPVSVVCGYRAIEVINDIEKKKIAIIPFFFVKLLQAHSTGYEFVFFSKFSSY